MIISLKNNFTILNIFKDELKLAKEFILYHSPLVKQIIMLNTGDIDVYSETQDFAKDYKNVSVFYQEFETVDFAQFRNAAKSFFIDDTPYYGWIDIDEQLNVSDDEHDFNSDILSVTRFDASNKFSTVLNRIFKSKLRGHWVNPIHEHFHVEMGSISFAPHISIFHLISEAARSEEKKKLYFDILMKQLKDAKESNDRQNTINALQHLILMASNDFRNPTLCISLFEENTEILFSAKTTFEISAVQKLNIFIHVIMSYARLKNKKALMLTPWIYEFDTTKSTVFQLLRALSFDEANHNIIKEFYQSKYKKLQIDQTEIFNNKDFSIPAEVKWFEKKIGL